MTERQLKLKSILDQYATCCSTIEDAELLLSEVFRETSPQTIFLETRKPMSDAQKSQFHREWRELYDDKMKAVLLPEGVMIANKQAFRPAQLDVNVGSVSVNVCGGGTGTVAVDGVPLKVRSAVITIEVLRLPCVQLEIVP